MRTVNAVAEQGMPDMSQMHPDLMGAAGLELAGEQGGDRVARGAIETLLHLPMGDGLAAGLAHRHFFPRMRMPVDRRIYGAALPVRDTPGKRHIAAPHRAGAAMVGELLG